MFDASRVKQNQINEVKAKEIKNSNKWDKMEKEMDRDEKINELEQKNHDQEVQDKLHKMMGCNQDHAAEIDIYNKPYAEKIKRIKLMKE